MPGFKEDSNYFVNGTVVEEKKSKGSITGLDSAGAVSFVKIFAYMFMYLAITAVVAFAGGFALYSALNNAKATGNDVAISNIITAYYGLMIASAITLIILVFVINFVVIRGKHSVLVPSIIYAVLVGVLFSSLTIFIDWRIIGSAFGITCGVFGRMTLIALFTKGNMSPLLMLGFGLIIGSGIIALVNFFMRSSTLYWVVSFAIFAAIMFISMFDIWNIKKICERGAMDKNLSYYCAFNMYVDFINIFIRVLYFLVLIYGKSKQS